MLRVAAVASVVVQHATYTVGDVLPWVTPTPFTWSIQAGANTLMVVSAYFVCVTLATRPPARWWADRLARLLPAYAVAVVVTYLATLYAAQYGYWRPSGRDLVGNLLLLQGWDSQRHLHRPLLLDAARPADDVHPRRGGGRVARAATSGAAGGRCRPWPGP